MPVILFLIFLILFVGRPSEKAQSWPCIKIVVWPAFLSADEVDGAAVLQYYLQDQLLVRKKGPHGNGFVGDPIVVIVGPKKIHNWVVQASHDVAGHWGVR